MPPSDDFKVFAAQMAGLEKGVFINAGSAVILPEVFLKAVTLVRNLGHTLDDFTTVNLDFIRHYRPHDQRGFPAHLAAGRGRATALSDDTRDSNPPDCRRCPGKSVSVKYQT